MPLTVTGYRRDAAWLIAKTAILTLFTYSGTDVAVCRHCYHWQVSWPATDTLWLTVVPCVSATLAGSYLPPELPLSGNFGACDASSWIWQRTCVKLRVSTQWSAKQASVQKKNIYFHSRQQYKQDNCIVSSIISSLHCPTAEGYQRSNAQQSWPPALCRKVKRCQQVLI